MKGRKQKENLKQKIAYPKIFSTSSQRGKSEREKERLKK